MSTLLFVLGLIGLIILAAPAVLKLIKLLPFGIGVAIALPLALYKSLKLAFTKGSTLYKWRFLVVFDVVALVAITILVVLD